MSSEDKFRILAQSASDAIISSDSFGRITFVNDAANHIFGYTNEELIGKSLVILMPEKYHDKHMLGILQATKNGGLRDKKLRFLDALRKDGTEFPIELSLFSWFSNDDINYGAIIRDVSHRRKNEEYISELSKILRERNEMLEAFNYSVCHDLNAPLRAMGGFAKALQEDYSNKLDAVGQDYLKRIVLASERMRKLIVDVMRLSGLIREQMTVEREPFSMSDLVTQVADETRVHYNNPDRFIFDIAADMNAKADRSLVYILLTNLIDNACKFSSRKASPEITVRLNGSVYSVMDNGVGFNQDNAEKLFRPFQRLTKDFDGTGVGLAIAKRVVELHDGKIWAEGRLGRGAIVHFTLGEKDDH